MTEEEYSTGQDGWLEVTGVEVGSVVKVLCAYTHDNVPSGWTAGHVDDAPRFIGKVGEVHCIYMYRGIQVIFPGYSETVRLLHPSGAYYNIFPYWCLVKVDKSELEGEC